MKIFFSVGEPSGDLHGANLIRQLRRHCPNLEPVGFGGPRMAAAGCRLHEDLTRLAIMWFGRVLLNLHKFLHLASRADRYFRHQRPDAVVLIDYPGLNWWIAWRAKVHGIPVFYYGTPQLWSWGGWRVRKMRRLVDHALCKLPFEQIWFRQRGVNATYVGHPYFDQLRGQTLDRQLIDSQAGKDGPLVTILPGSRTQEVTSNLHWFLQAAALVHQQVPRARFAVAAFNEKHARLARAAVGKLGLPVEVFVGRTPELMYSATCTMACSGSVSLELLYHLKPTVILYWISRPAYFVQSFFLKVKYITLVNLLVADELCPKDCTPYDPQAPDADEVLFPEYLTYEDKSRQIAGHIVQWLTDRESRDRCVARLRRLKEQVGSGGASEKAAEYILAHGGRQPAAIPRPHFMPGATKETPVAQLHH